MMLILQQQHLILGNRLRVDTASQGLTGTQQANAITNTGITATKAELNYKTE